MNNTTKMNAWFGKIESKEDAIKVIKESSNSFLVLAAIQIGLGFIIGMSAAIDGIIYAIMALLLRKFKSRIVAVLLLLFSLLAVVVTGINKFGGGESGRNIILTLIMLWASIRAIQSIFKYNKVK